MSTSSKLFNRLHEKFRRYDSHAIEKSKDIKTIMIYTRVLDRSGKGVRSPLDT